MLVQWSVHSEQAVPEVAGPTQSLKWRLEMQRPLRLPPTARANLHRPEPKAAKRKGQLSKSTESRPSRSIKHNRKWREGGI